jgi:hypothetical protein
MIKLYKKIAETPLQALKRLRRRRPELADARLSYAGRLDPMACGILPVLVGEENDRRENFLGRDKTYVFTVLFGVATDTFDLLGIPKKVTSSFGGSNQTSGWHEKQGKESKVDNFDNSKHFVNNKNFLLTKSKFTLFR